MKKVLIFLISALFVLAAFTGCNQDYKNTGSFCMVMPSANITIPDYAEGGSVVIDKVLYKVKITPYIESVPQSGAALVGKFYTRADSNTFYRYAESGETLVIDNLEPGYYEFNFFAFADYRDGFYLSSQFVEIDDPLSGYDLNYYPNFLKIEANKVCSLDVQMSRASLPFTPSIYIDYGKVYENEVFTCTIGSLLGKINKLTAKIYINDKLYATKSYENLDTQSINNIELPYKSSILKKGNNTCYAIIDYDDYICKTTGKTEFTVE